MRTLFLLGILGALIVIATKENNQTAMEAAMEIGLKAQNLVTEHDKAKAVNTIQEKVEETRKTATKKVDPFIRQAKEAIAKSQKGTPRKMPKKVTPQISLKSAVEEKTPPEKPEWIMPKPRELAMPDIPAMPKSIVEKVELGASSPLELANADPAPVDVGRSYDLVKGYYENASRLLEEIK